MALTAAQLISEVETLIELSGTDIDTSVGRYLNLAGRELWCARLWDEKKKEVILLTVAPYTTGTVTITNASTTLTGSGTTFTSAMVGRKFCLATGGPFYRISAYVSATQLTLARAYQETTASGSGFTIYQDEYDVATDLDVITSVNLNYTRDRGQLRSVTESELDTSSYATSAVTAPQAFAPTVETTAGTYRIRIWPIPDQVYAMRVLYLKGWTDIATTDVSGLGSNKDRLLLYATTLLAQKIPGCRQATSEAEVAALTEKVWREQQSQIPLSGSRERFDRGVVWRNTIQIDTSSL